MQKTYDIFRKLSDGHAIWVEAVAGFEAVTKRLFDLLQLAPGDYFACDLASGAVIATARPHSE